MSTEDKETTNEAAEAAAEETKEPETAAEPSAAEAEQQPEAAAEQPAAGDELAKAEDKYLRLYAEFDNFRKRSRKEKEDLYTDVKANTMKEFLPVYDNLERALAQSTEDEAYRKGVEMIMTQFCKTMEKLGVTQIESLGKTFDPTLHNAIMHEENAEKGENEIVEVFQQGFKCGEKVIRCAMVKVAN